MRYSIILTLALLLALPASAETVINGSRNIKGDLTVDGVLDVGTVETWADLDATPDVSTGAYFNTFTNAITVTDMDGGVAGQLVVVHSQAAVTFDCTAAGFDCGTTDIVTAAGDTTYWMYDGTDWDLLAYKNSADDMGTDSGAGGGGIVNSIQGDGDVQTTGAAVSIDGGTGITTAVVGDILTITGHAATTDTGPIPDCTGTELQDAAGTCVTNLTELNTSLGSSLADGAHFTPTDLDTDYATQTITTQYSFVPVGTGAMGAYDAEFGDTTTPDYGGIQIGRTGIYSSAFAASGLDIGGALLFRQEANIDVGNDPGIEFVWMEQGNTVRALIPESGAGNAANFFRSFMISGPYSAVTGNDHVLCDTHTAFNGNIDCDSGLTGADMFIDDDLEVEGTIFAHETINLEGATADGNQVILQVGADPGSDVTITLPTTTGSLVTGAHFSPTAGIATDHGAGAITATTDLSATLCGTGEILEDQGASWACITTPAGGSYSWDVTDTDASPIQTVDNTEQVQFIGAGTVTIALTADTTNHDVTITGSAHDGNNSCDTGDLTCDLSDDTTNTETTGNNTTQLSSTAFVQQELATQDACSEITGCVENAITSTGVTYENLDTNSDIGFGASQVPAGNLTAPLASPALTGTPTSTTAAQNTDSTQIATMAALFDRFQGECRTIESATTADLNLPVFIPLNASTIEAVACHGDAAATVRYEDFGGTAIETFTCDTTGTVTPDTAMSGTATLTAGEVMRIDFTAASSPTWVVVCYWWSNT